MGYSLLQISEILLKADKTMYRLGTIAYENMFSEDSEDVDFERDIIYIYKKAVEYADDFYVGTTKLDQVVERLANKLTIYNYGSLNPIYSDVSILNPVLPTGYVLNDLADVTITNLQDNQILKYSAALGQWVNTGSNAAIRSTQAFTATLNQTVFVTTSPFTTPLLDVYLNGVRLNSSSYSTFGNYTITLYDGCLADDIIDVTIYDPQTDILDMIGYVKETRTLTINGVTYDLSADRTWTLPTGDMTKAVYDTDNDGIVDDAEKITIIARNSTGSTIHKGKIVYLQGSTGNRPNILLAQANSEASSSKTFGVVVEDIAHNADGQVAAIGTLHDLDTRSNATNPFTTDTLVDGDKIWLSATNPGYVTKTPPTQPNHTVFIGFVARTTPSFGRIIYNIQNGFELDELHNVLITSAANKDILNYDLATGLWKNTAKSGWLGGTASQFVKGDGTLDSSTYLTTGTAASTYVALGGSYSNPSWITALAWSKITGAPTFLTTETDPIFTAHPAYGITGTKISNWDDAYTWVANFPTQSGNSGKFLTTNGSALSWADVVSGVSSFNTRTGAVTLTSGDVTVALGYTPVSTNIYTDNGTLTGDRTVNYGGYFLNLNGNTKYIGTGGFTGTTAKSYTSFITNDVFNNTTTDSGIGVTIRTDNTSVSGSPISEYSTTALSVDSKITNNGTTFVSTRAIRALAFARSMSESGRVNFEGVSITAQRNSPSDLSTNGSNSISGISVNTGHNYGSLSTIYTGLVYGVQNNIQWASGNGGSVFANSVNLSQSSFSIHKNSTISNFYAYYSGATVGTDIGITGSIANYYGLFLDSVIVRTGGTITNRWGVYAPDPSMRHYLNGNLLLGTTTDAGYKLDVNGTARVSGLLTTSAGVIGTYANFSGNAAFGSATQIAIGGNGGFGGGASYWFEVVSNNLTINAGGSAVSAVEFVGSGGSTGTYTGLNSALSQRTVTMGYTAGLTGYHNQFKAVLNATGNAFANTLYVRGFFVDGGIITPNSTTIIPIGFENVSGSNLFNSTSGSTQFGGIYTDLNASAKVQVNSTAQGFLPPRMTTTQRDAIASPATGLVIYNTTTLAPNVYNGTSWGAMGGDNIYTANGTLTSNRTVTSGGYNLTFTGTNTAVSALGRGVIFTPTVLPAANNDTVIGVDINPSFGTFSYPNNYNTFTASPIGVRIIGNTPINFNALDLVNTATNAGENISLNFYDSSSRSLFSALRYTLGGGGATSSLAVFVHGQEVAKYSSTGNVIIQTGGTFTDAGYKLDVNGTARVSGGIVYSGGSYVAGSIYYSSSLGIVIAGNTGSGSDLTLTDRNGSERIKIINGGFVTLTATSINGVEIGSGSINSNISNSSQYGLQIWGRTSSTSNYAIQMYADGGSNGVFIGNNGNLVIGALSTTNVSTAILQANSTTKGFLPPRMTSTERTAISSPAVGLIVYQTNGTEGTYEYTSSGWRIINAAGGGSGTVTTVSVASANGFAGTVANATTTPAITISTTVTGLLKGNGTAISAATAGTDYLTPSDVAYSVANVSTTYSETATKGTKIIKADTTGGAFTINLPTAVGNTATIIIKKVAGSGALTIDGNSTETIDGGTTATINKVYESITLISDNTNWQIV